MLPEIDFKEKTLIGFSINKSNDVTNISHICNGAEIEVLDH
jgi:hypothetical protein